MKNARVLCLVSILSLLLCAGCLGRMFGGPESPRPEPYQVDATKEIAVTNVAEIMKGQLGKQTGIGEIAIAAISAMAAADSNAKVEGITNIVANAANEIRRADGSAGLLSALSGNASKSISEMSALEYIAYTASQTAVVTGNRERVAKGVSLGLEKVSKLTIAGAGTGVIGSLVALGIGMMRRGRKAKEKDLLLKTTGNTINEFSAKNPDAAKELKGMIAKSTSTLPVDAKTEFGI